MKPETLEDIIRHQLNQKIEIKEQEVKELSNYRNFINGKTEINKSDLSTEEKAKATKDLAENSPNIDINRMSASEIYLGLMNDSSGIENEIMNSALLDHQQIENEDIKLLSNIIQKLALIS